MKYPYVVFEMNGFTLLDYLLKMKMSGVQFNEMLVYDYQKEIKKLFPKAKKVIPRIRLPSKQGKETLSRISNYDLNNITIKEVWFRGNKSKTIKIDDIE